MTRYFLFLLLIIPCSKSLGQEITGKQLLDKAIQHHDPKGNWKSFKGMLEVTMTTPDEKQRISTIQIDLPERFFTLSYAQDKNSLVLSVQKNDCTLSFNGSTSIPNEAIEKYKLTCDRAKRMRDYYTYLYGLPMKLTDSGTIIDPKVERKTFKGKEYLVLKATYEKEVGRDIWYFYFDPKTYAMEVYQFFHDEAKNDGEYILLSDQETISKIKMPKTRAWYFNKDDKYLGTDVLTKISSF